MRSVIGIGILMVLSLTGVEPAAASHGIPSRPAAALAARPLNTGSLVPRTAYNTAGLQKEVLAFAPYWALAQHLTWNYNVMSTVAYFGLSINWDGTWITSAAGYSGYNSQDFVDMVNEAHQAGDRVVLVIKASGEAPLNDILTVPAETQLVIDNTIAAIAAKNLDGVNIDFEGYTSSTYPNIQTGLTNFTTQMSAQVHQRWPGAFVSIDTYTGAASWDLGLMKIGDLAPVVDAMFIMAYDMPFDNMPGQAGPNAPMSGWTYNDTTAISQYLTKAPASKIIMGVPWYGYRFNTSSDALYAPTSSATPDSYDLILKDLACGKGLVRHWDGPSQSPWASWYSPSSGDPCGKNLGSWQELYYDNVQSLGVKYDLVNSSGIRGTGIWALGYDGGAPELWSELNTYFSCPVTMTPAATQTTTEFNLGLSAGSCSVSSFDVQQYDSTQNQGWYPLATVPGTSPSVVVQGFPGYTYQFRARAHSTAGVVSAWSTMSTSVNADATYSHPYKGLYTFDAYGGISADTSPPVATGAYWPGWAIARAARALPGTMPQSGAVLDGYGGLHSYGAPITFSGGPYWPRWDIARDFAFLPDGTGGYVLDAYGGLHPFAVNGAAMPPAAQTTAYWGGHDIARKVVIFSDGTGGYVMDLYGGLQPFGIGVAPPADATGGPYWPRWAIARDVVLVPGSHGGYVLDGYGGVHPFSGSIPLATPAYWGWDIARSLVLLPSSTPAAPAGYVMDGYGGPHPFGGAPALPNFQYWPGHDIARNLLGY